MDRSVLSKRMLRFSLVSAIVVVLVMGYQFFSQGDIAVVTEIFGYQLPMGISIWWDVVFVPVWVSLIVLALSQFQTVEKKKTTSSDFVWTFGVIFGLFASFMYGATYGFMLGLVVGLVVLGACFILGFILVLAVNGIQVLWDWLIVEKSISSNPEGDKESD